MSIDILIIIYRGRFKWYVTALCYHSLISMQHVLPQKCYDIRLITERLYRKYKSISPLNPNSHCSRKSNRKKVQKNYNNHLYRVFQLTWLPLWLLSDTFYQNCKTWNLNCFEGSISYRTYFQHVLTIWELKYVLELTSLNFYNFN